ncbi:MAG: phosphoribulokinase [Clostridia bacterium]|nr:phosphoribulokinase [Clostridia bacterium]
MEELYAKIERLLRESEEPVCISIEGGAGSGKTTLAAALQKKFGGNVYHMDDFFLPPQLRTPERLAEPGGNVDYDRFYGEVVEGIFSDEPFTYGVMDCKEGRITRWQDVHPADLHIVEGVYSAHPYYEEIYDLRVFIEVDKETQRARILARSPEKADRFFDEWIPMEDRYFEAFSVKEKSDIIL